MNDIGHNKPPSDAQIVADELRIKHAFLLERAAELMSAAKSIEVKSHKTAVLAVTCAAMMKVTAGKIAAAQEEAAARANEELGAIKRVFLPGAELGLEVDHLRMKLLDHGEEAADEYGNRVVFSHIEEIVTDITKVPREYLMVNKSAIKKALKAGEEIPGVKTKKVKSISIR